MPSSSALVVELDHRADEAGAKLEAQRLKGLTWFDYLSDRQQRDVTLIATRLLAEDYVGALTQFNTLQFDPDKISAMVLPALLSATKHELKDGGLSSWRAITSQVVDFRGEKQMGLFRTAWDSVLLIDAIDCLEADEPDRARLLAVHGSTPEVRKAMLEEVDALELALEHTRDQALTQELMRELPPIDL